MRLLVAFILFVLASVSGAAASEGARLSLLEGGYGKSRTQLLYGLKVDLAAGWHSYWVSPGETGLPPDLKLVDKNNVGDARLLWPLPTRFDASGFETVGYEGSFIIPFSVPVNDSAKPASFRLKGTFYACSDICVPFPVDLRSEAMQSFSNRSAITSISQWLAKAPLEAGSGLTVIEASRAGDGDLMVTFASERGMKTPSAFVDLGMDGFASLKSLDVAQDGTATARFSLSSMRTAALDMVNRQVVLSDGAGSVASIPLVITSSTDLSMLAVAFLGGLILNIMPCVLPVLTIKLFSLVSVPVARRRVSFGMTALGIVSAFLVLAAALSALKAAGQTVGWGIQFQEPIFLALMATLVAAFGVNLAGAFEIGIPSGIATRLSLRTDGQGRAASFGQGLVLTLLATPCSAPFVGTAIGYALSRGTYDILSIFAAMGIGMAMPYLILSAVPGAAALMPRPGRWMLQVKNVMSLAMFATFGWLVYLLSVTFDPILGAAFGVLITAAILFALLRVRTSRLLTASIVLASLAAPAAFFAGDKLVSDKDSIHWGQFDPVSIISSVESGRIVFVNISADWCLTCKVNERGVLASTEISTLINDKTVPMKGDWTRPDQKISEFLKIHGRFGIPFYLVIGPGRPDGVILPELLTREAIVEAVTSASRLE